jgi:hypothetical protein
VGIHFLHAINFLDLGKARSSEHSTKREPATFGASVSVCQSRVTQLLPGSSVTCCTKSCGRATLMCWTSHKSTKVNLPMLENYGYTYTLNSLPKRYSSMCLFLTGSLEGRLWHFDSEILQPSNNQTKISPTKPQIPWKFDGHSSRAYEHWRKRYK